MRNVLWNFAVAVASIPLGTGASAAPHASGETPAERAIERARADLAEGEATVEELVALGAALSRRARETSDPEWYGRSDTVLRLALEKAPGVFTAERQRVWNMLGRHEFADALVAAGALNERAKDDVATYGLMVDACVELGRYAEAEEAAQWMLNLRPGAPAAMTRVSYLREQFGDIPGAVEAMRMAFHSTRPTDAEERAWILTHLAHLELERGKVDAAEPYARGALEAFPNYHYALKELARVHTLRGQHAAAVEVLERRYDLAPHPENLFDVGCAKLDGGDAGGASLCFAEFEELALEEAGNVDNANLQLIDYWLDVAPNEARIARALELAVVRARGRRDIGTLEALAWAQHGSGESAAAWTTMQAALAVGTKNARVRLRAGRIAAALGDDAAAKNQLEAAWMAAPGTPEGRAARAALLGRDD